MIKKHDIDEGSTLYVRSTSKDQLLCRIDYFNPSLTQRRGVTMTPYKFSSGCAIASKDFTKRFYDIVIFILFCHFGENKIRGTTSNGVMVSCQKSKVAGVTATEPVLFNGKSTKMRFFIFGEQIFATFVLDAIFL